MYKSPPPRYLNWRTTEKFYLKFDNWDKSGASFCRQVAAWVPDMFCKFHLKTSLLCFRFSFLLWLYLIRIAGPDTYGWSSMTEWTLVLSNLAHLYYIIVHFDHPFSLFLLFSLTKYLWNSTEGALGQTSSSNYEHLSITSIKSFTTLGPA